MQQLPTIRSIFQVMVAKIGVLQSHDLPNFSALALVWDTTYNEDILYLGMNYGIYYLRDNETTWTSYDTGLPNVQVRELEINTADNKCMLPPTDVDFGVLTCLILKLWARMIYKYQI